jgi:hypothetical protein
MLRQQVRRVAQVALTLAAVVALAAPAQAGGFQRVHRGDTRTQVNHRLGDHGQRLWGYRDHGAQHRVRRYPTDRPHVWIVIDYRVRPHHLRLWFKAHCRWDADGVDCWPGATS